MKSIKIKIILGLAFILAAAFVFQPASVQAQANCTGISDPIICQGTIGCQWSGNACTTSSAVGPKETGCAASGLGGAACCESFPGDPVCTAWQSAGGNSNLNPGSNGGNSQCPPGTGSVNGFCVPVSNYNPNSAAGTSTLAELILLVIKYMLILSGMIAVVALIVGGFWYITAAGNDEQAEKGRKALTNAIIGLVIVILAYAVVNIIIQTLTTNDILKKGGTTTTQTP